MDKHKADSYAVMIWALRKYGQVGPRTFRALMIHFPTLSSIFGAEIEEIMEISGLGEKRSRKIYECDQFMEQAEQFMKDMEEQSVGVCTILDDDYPSGFHELNDPPPIFFYRGRLPRKDEKLVSLIGSREATTAGISRTVELAGKLAEKSISIVSGLARGIDSAAHIGALKADGSSFAVLGSGFEHIYPEENRPLAEELLRNGGLISEYPPHEKQTAGRLLDRNRLTVGLSQAVVIGEISGQSAGTLDCAAFCHETGQLAFILVDDGEISNESKETVEKVLSMGIIPVTANDAVEKITRSLV